VPNISGLAELDAAIGLAFMFFLLATAASSINELLASYLGWRAKNLEDGLRSMFNDPAVQAESKKWFAQLRGHVADTVVNGLATKKLEDFRVSEHAGEADAAKQGTEGDAAEQGTEGDAAEQGTEGGPGKLGDLTTTLFDHWRLKALVRDPHSPSRRRCRPSYLPPAALSRALMEQLAALGGHPMITPVDVPSDVGPTAWAVADEKLFEDIKKGIANLDHPAPGLAEALERATRKPEATLEEFRKTVEGWFDETMARASGWYKRKVQAVLLVIAIVLGVGLNVDSVHVASRLWKEPALRSAVAARATAAAKSTGGSATTSPSAQQTADEIDKVRQLNLPVGWGKTNRPSGVTGWVGSLAGWIITIAAISLGAPFWFDLLSKLARLRGSGSPDAPRDLSDKSAAAGARARTTATT
jgi:hypothetical protein